MSNKTAHVTTLTPFRPSTKTLNHQIQNALVFRREFGHSHNFFLRLTFILRLNNAHI